MKNFSVLLLLLLTANMSNATGFSGLNNEPMLLYGILIGDCAAVILITKGIGFLRGLLDKKSERSAVGSFWINGIF
jgi:hypothetical protein